jgi:spermidine/putrescine transport system ATP-binding protein
MAGSSRPSDASTARSPGDAVREQTAPIVLFQGIAKNFGNVVALDNVTLEVHTGEFLSLLGPSGCGKTTLLRTCAGLESPTRGRVYLESKDVTDWPAHRRPVNMVFQRWALFPHKTVAENIAFGLLIKHLPRAQVTERVRGMLELVKMSGYEDRYPKQLSGGQAQRIALARALVLRPKVLLLDEPLGSLDLKLRKEMQIELINIHRRLGTTFIYVTHDQEEALTMSDRVVVMNKGMIVQDGSPAEIYQKPNSVFAAQFIGEAVLFRGRIVDLNSGRCDVDVDGQILHCQNRPDLSLGQEVSVCVRPERMRITPTFDTTLDNHLQGRIVNTIFKGPAVHYQVQVQGGPIVTVHQNLEQDTPLHLSGSTVHVGWSGENCVPLPG